MPSYKDIMSHLHVYNILRSARPVSANLKVNILIIYAPEIPTRLLNHLFPAYCSDEVLLMKRRVTHSCLILYSFSWVCFLKVEKPCCLTHCLISSHGTGHWQARGSSASGLGVPSWPMGCVREYRVVSGRVVTPT